MEEDSAPNFTDTQTNPDLRQEYLNGIDLG